MIILGISYEKFESKILDDIMKLGIHKDTLELYEHNIMWKEIAKDTIKELKEIFGFIAIDIQHIGSTAINNIRAKPIIDIVVGISNFTDFNSLKEKLAHREYIYRPFKVDDELLMKGNMETNTRTHYIHVVIHNSKQWNNQINFRDYLNFHIKEAKEYEKLKIKLFKDNQSNIIDYQEGKNEYIEKIIKKANIWRMKNIVKSQTST